MRGLRPPLSVTVLAFELGIGVLGLVLCRLVHGGVGALRVSPGDGVIDGLWFGAPMFAFAFFATSSFALARPGFRGIYRVLRDSFVGSFVRESHPAMLVLVALAAGLGEEILFRGALQPWLGLVWTAIVFGALHAVTPAYFLVAAAIGWYLGYAYEATGLNLFVPVMIHALYDLIALFLYRYRMLADPALRLGGGGESG